MSLPRTARALILAVVWIVTALHSGVCEAALAQVTNTAAHRCCGLPAAGSTQPGPLDCGDCPACTTAGAPEVVNPTTPEVHFLPTPFFAPLLPDLSAALPLHADVGPVENIPPPSRPAVTCLTSSPNAPPFS